MPAWDCPRRRGTRSSGHSLRPRMTALAWGYQSAGRLSSLMEAVCGAPRALGGGQLLSSPSPPRSRSIYNVSNPRLFYMGYPIPPAHAPRRSVQALLVCRTKARQDLGLPLCEDEGYEG